MAEPGQDEENVYNLLGLQQAENIFMGFDGFKVEAAHSAGGGGGSDTQTVEEGASYQQPPLPITAKTNC